MAVIITAQKDKGLRQQMQEFLKSKAKGRKKRWDLFFGKVKFGEDPVDYQRNLRAPHQTYQVLKTC